jgi:hypothetical protein
LESEAMTTERIDYIVAVSVKAKQHPYRNTFPGFVHKMINTKFFATERTIQSDLQTLNSAWFGDKWAELLAINPYIEKGVVTQQEMEEWAQNCRQGSCIL